MEVKEFSVEHLSELEVYDEQGAEVPLASLWAAQTAALIFIRHFG